MTVICQAVTRDVPTIVVSTCRRNNLRRRGGYSTRVTEKVGVRVKRLREGKKWSLTELARASGVERTTINRIEKGKQQPHPSTIQMLIDALTRPSKGADGQTTVVTSGGIVGIEDHLAALISHLKTLDPEARGKFVRAVTAVLNSLEHASPAAGSGTAENHGR